VIAPWIPVTLVPTSFATVAIETFMTELSRTIRNWPAASVSKTSVAPPARADGAISDIVTGAILASGKRCTVSTSPVRGGSSVGSRPSSASPCPSVRNAANVIVVATAIVVVASGGRYPGTRPKGVSCGSAEIEFAIGDDGIGIKTRASADSVGLLSMKDRIGVVGGELEIVSSPGAGTRVRGTVPDNVLAASGTIGGGPGDESVSLRSGASPVA